MLKTDEILDKLAEKTGSDYATAKALGVTTQSIYAIRKNGWTLKEPALIRAAEILDLDPIFLILSAATERSFASPAFKDLERLANDYEAGKHAKKHAAKVAAAVGILATCLASSLPYLQALPLT